MGEGRTNERTKTQTPTVKGFFSIPDPSGKRPKKGDDLLIPREWLGTALPGDTVKVVTAGMVDRRKAGKVVGVVKRARVEFVGLLAKTERGNVILIPDSKRMYVPFMIAEKDKADAVPFPLGHKV